MSTTSRRLIGLISRRSAVAMALALASIVIGSANAASAASSLTLRVTSPPHFSAAIGGCPAGHVADTVTAVDGGTLGELDGCFQTFVFFGDGSDSFTATYTFDVPGGRIVTSIAGHETPTPTGVVMAVTGTIVGGTGLYGGSSGAISGGGPVDFTSGIQPNLVFVLSFS